MAPSRVKSTSHRRLRSALPSIGPFENLPSDCFHVILKWIPLEDIGNLGITSRRMRSLVWNWAQSSSCLNRGSLFLMPFSLLCKRITMLLSTKERVDFMVDIFHKCLIQSHSERGMKTEEEKEFSSPWNIPCNEKFVNYFLNYGQMLFTFTRGWAEGEYSILLPALDEFFAISDRLTKYLGYIFNSPRDFFNKENGIVDFEIQTIEKELKLVIRALWWDLTQSEFSFRGDWLMANMDHFLGPAPLRHAILVYLICGPSLSNTVRGDVEEMEEEEGPLSQDYLKGFYANAHWGYMTDLTPINFHEGKKIFKEISQCICHLRQSSRRRRNGYLMELLGVLFVLPRPWMKDNIAGLLLFCNEEVLLSYMSAKIDTESVEGLSLDISARLLMDIIVESYRFRNEIIYGKGVGIIVDKVLRYVPQPSRSGFIDALWDLLQGEIELSGEHTPIDEAIIGFGRFLSRRSTYVMAKRVLSFPNDEAKRTRVLEEEDSSSHEE